MALTHVARRPICDRSLSIVGYELLCRADAVTNEAIFSDAGVATSSALISAFSGMSLESLLDDNPASMKISKDLLFNDIPNLFASDRAVIEARANSGDDPDVEFALAELYRQGYRITLEGWDSTRPPSALWDIATTIKVDMRSVSARQAKSLAETIHSQVVRALAE